MVLIGQSFDLAVLQARCCMGGLRLLVSLTKIWRSSMVDQPTLILDVED